MHQPISIRRIFNNQDHEHVFFNTTYSFIKKWKPLGNNDIDVANMNSFAELWMAALKSYNGTTPLGQLLPLKFRFYAVGTRIVVIKILAYFLRFH